MSSQRRIDASRANGAKSRGPKTPEGKARSSQNALTHGLLSRHVVLCNENPATFEELFARFRNDLQPVGEVEYSLVEEMAVAHWRIRRCWAAEAETLNQAIGTQPIPGTPEGEKACTAIAFADAAPKLAPLQRYETRLHRMFQRALYSLQKLRAPQPNDPAPLPAAESPRTQPLDAPETQECETNLTPESDTPPIAASATYCFSVRPALVMHAGASLNSSAWGRLQSAPGFSPALARAEFKHPRR